MTVRMAVQMRRMRMPVVRMARAESALGIVVLVTVMPQFGLVEQKEKHQPHKQRGKQMIGADMAFKGFGQQVHESRSQERARRQAEHVLRVARQHAKAEYRRQPDAANAGDHGSH